MTMIIGMETTQGIIIATDGLARFNLKGLEHLGSKISETTEKISIVAPKILVGVTGSKVNWQRKFVSDVTAFASQNPAITAEDVARQLPKYIEYLYGENRSDPEFFISVFVAGVTDTEEKKLLVVSDGDVMAWPDDNKHPWLTVGHQNETPDAFIQSRYKGRLMGKLKTVQILKEALAVASEKVPEAIGGHTFIYEITKKGITRLE